MAATSDIVMPKLGLTMTEGILAEWKVQPGSTVHAGDTLFVVETEKVANDVAADRDGVIDALLIEAGATVPVGAPIARFRGMDGAPPPKETEARQPPSSPKTARAQSTEPRLRSSDHRTNATPYARRLARERGIDLSTLQGTGPRGRIKAADVESARSSIAQTASFAVAGGSDPYQFLLKVDCTRLISLQRDIMNSMPDADIPVTAFVVMAVARAARPALNSAIAQSDALAVTTRSGTVAIDRAHTWRPSEIAKFIAGNIAPAPRNSICTVSIVDLGLAAAEFVAPPPGAEMLSVGVGTVRSAHLGLSIAIGREIEPAVAAEIVDAITKNLEQPWAMLA